MFSKGKRKETSYLLDKFTCLLKIMDFYQQKMKPRGTVLDLVDHHQEVLCNLKLQVIQNAFEKTEQDKTCALKMRILERNYLPSP